MLSPSELMNEGIMLMVFGMGFVFVFLTLLVISTTVMSKVVMLFDSGEPEPSSAPSPARVAQTAAQDPNLLAVISEAIKQHRTR